MKKIAIILLAMAMVLSLCACVSPDAPPEPTKPATVPTTVPATEPTESIPQEDISLTMLRQAMIETPTMFAVAYLGYIHEPVSGTVPQLLQDFCPELLNQYPFIAEIPQERLLGGNTGELYLIVPRFEDATVRLGQIEESYGLASPNTQVIYQSEAGDPFLLIANGGDSYPDHQLIITEKDGKQITWYPLLDEKGYVNLPLAGDAELALDITFRQNEDPLEDWLRYGWSMPDEALLCSTGWYFQDYFSEQPITYVMELYADGNVSFYSSYAGESDYLEEYHGVWSTHVEGDYRYLNLNMERTGGAAAHPDEIPVSIVDTFPVLVHYEETSLLLGKGLYECELPFVTDGFITAVFEASAG